MMDFWTSVFGMLEVEMTSAEPSAALADVNRHNIPVYKVFYVSDLTVRFQIHRTDHRKLSDILNKRGDTLKLRKRIGVFWRVKSLLARPVLTVGVLLMLVFVLYLPTRVLFVRVEGNRAVPARQIIAAAEELGIRFWASRREVRSESVKNALLSAVPELQWAGVNTSGCVAVISVRERVVPEEAKTESGVCSIVAQRDGIVESCTATRGNLLCKPGDAVKAGQILISGYTDCGLFLQAAQAEGEVYAFTRRDLTVISPRFCAAVTKTGTQKHKYSLLIGKKRINLWKDSGIWDTSCGRMYTEYYVTLPGGFALPVALAVETYTLREKEDSLNAIPTENLSEFAREYLEDQMVAGKIESSFLSFSDEEDVLCLTGSYVCREMIGRVQREQIGESYVENG